MTQDVRTAFARDFSEPPAVTLSTTRAHCDACGDPLQADIAHQCAGNQRWEPPTATHHPDLSNYKGICPECNGRGGKLLDEAGTLERCELCGGTGEIR